MKDKLEKIGKIFGQNVPLDKTNYKLDNFYLPKDKREDFKAFSSRNEDREILLPNVDYEKNSLASENTNYETNNENGEENSSNENIIINLEEGLNYLLRRIEVLEMSLDNLNEVVSKIPKESRENRTLEAREENDFFLQNENGLKKEGEILFSSKEEMADFIEEYLENALYKQIYAGAAYRD